MKLIYDELDKLIPPKPKFKLNKQDDVYIALEAITTIDLLPDEGVLSKMVNVELCSSAGHVRFMYNQGIYDIIKSAIADNIYREILDNFKRVWLKVNKKIEFNRTKFSDAVLSAEHRGRELFRNEIISLYLDMDKYGIKDELLQKDVDPSRMAKFFSSQFQQVVNKYGS